MNAGSLKQNCSLPFDTLPFKIVAAVHAFSGSVSLLCSVTAIIIAMVLRKYFFFAQRLVIYYSMSVSLYGLSSVVQSVDFFVKSEGTDWFCVLAGFIFQYTLWTVLMSTCCISLATCSKTFIQNANFNLDAACVVLIYIIPLAFNWIPFVGVAYGRSGPSCWIRITNEDCSTSTFGIVLRYALWLVPSGAVILFTIVAYAGSLVKVYQRSKDDIDFQLIRKKTMQKVAPLVWFPVSFALVNVPCFVNNIYETLFPNKTLLILWAVHAILTPLGPAVIAVALSYDREMCRRMNMNVAAACCPCGRSSIYEYQTQTVDGSSSDNPPNNYGGTAQ